jgi:TRAP-type mannitol/chloroaromatic compound transport system permease small subunit
MRNLESLLHLIDIISKWTGQLAGWLLFGLIGSISYEIIMRYVFGASQMWSFEISTYLFGTFFFLGGAYALIHEDHVRMDVIYARLSPKNKAIMRIVTFVFFFIYIGIMVWKGGELAWKAFHFAERTDSAWAPLTWPIRLVIPVGAFLMLLQGLAQLVRDIITATRRGG